VEDQGSSLLSLYKNKIIYNCISRWHHSSENGQMLMS